MRSYGAARGLFSFLEFMAWLGVVGGGFLFLTSIGIGGSEFGFLGFLAFLILGGLLALSSFMMVAMIQIGRATVDSAEYGQLSLDVARKQLAVSQQLLHLGKQEAYSYADRELDAGRLDPPSDTQNSGAPRGAASYADLQIDDIPQEAQTTSEASPSLADVRPLAEIPSEPSVPFEGPIRHPEPVSQAPLLVASPVSLATDSSQIALFENAVDTAAGGAEPLGSRQDDLPDSPSLPFVAPEVFMPAETPTALPDDAEGRSPAESNASEAPAAEPATLAAAFSASDRSPRVMANGNILYRGQVIRRTGYGYFFDGTRAITAEAILKEVDKQLDHDPRHNAPST